MLEPEREGGREIGVKTCQRGFKGKYVRNRATEQVKYVEM